MDFRSDQFSFGSILYEMARGRRAFERPTPAQTLVGDHRGRAGAARQGRPEGADESRLDRRAVSREGSRGSVRLDEGPRAGSRDDARSLLGDLGLRRRAAGLDDGCACRALLWRPPRWRVAAIAASTFFVGQPRRRLAATGRRRRRRGTDAHFPPRLPDGRALRSRRPDDRLLGCLGRKAERDLHDARGLEPSRGRWGIFPAGILAVSSTGEMAISLGCENRGDPCFGTLARVPLAGGAPREVLENVGSADWSPDGKELAVIHVVEGRDRIEYPIGKVLYESDRVLTAVRVSPKGDLVAFIEHPRRDSNAGSSASSTAPAGRRA